MEVIGLPGSSVLHVRKLISSVYKTVRAVPYKTNLMPSDCELRIKYLISRDSVRCGLIQVAAGTAETDTTEEDNSNFAIKVLLLC
jgi:hypothetical protein